MNKSSLMKSNSILFLIIVTSIMTVHSVSASTLKSSNIQNNQPIKADDGQANQEPIKGPQFDILVERSGKPLAISLVPRLLAGDNLIVKPKSADFNVRERKAFFVVLVNVNGPNLARTQVQARLWKQRESLSFPLDEEGTPVLIFLPRTLNTRADNIESEKRRAIDTVYDYFRDRPQLLLKTQGAIVREREKLYSFRLFLNGFQEPPSDHSGSATALYIKQAGLVFGITLRDEDIGSGTASQRLQAAKEAIEKLKQLSFDFTSLGRLSRTALEDLAKRRGWDKNQVGGIIDAAIGAWELIDSIIKIIRREYIYVSLGANPRLSSEIEGAYSTGYISPQITQRQILAFIFAPKSEWDKPDPELNAEFENRNSCVANGRTSLLLLSKETIQRLDLRDYKLIVEGANEKLFEKKLKLSPSGSLVAGFTDEELSKIKASRDITLQINALYGFGERTSQRLTPQLKMPQHLTDIGLSSTALTFVSNDSIKKLRLISPLACCVQNVKYWRKGEYLGIPEIKPADNGYELSLDLRQVEPGEGQLEFITGEEPNNKLVLPLQVTEPLPKINELEVIVRAGEPRITLRAPKINDVLKVVIDNNGEKIEYLRNSSPIKVDGKIQATFVSGDTKATQFSVGQDIVITLYNTITGESISKSVKVSSST